MYKVNDGFYRINAKYVYDLPICDRKSWYGKAKVFETENEIFLQSYDTFVCYFDKEKKIFEKLWDGYSATSMRHINCFMRYIGFMCGGKKWWNSLKVRKEYTISELLNII